jgi:beta-glucosidase
MLLSADTISVTDSLNVSITLTNKGSLDGKESVLLFVSDEVASISQPVKRLRRFQKVNLKAGNSQALSFKLGTSDLQFVNANQEWVSEPGYFTLSIGNQKARFYLKN